MSFPNQNKDAHNKEDLPEPDLMSDALDDYFQAHLETCDCCRSATSEIERKAGATSRTLLSQSASIKFLEEPEFLEAVTKLQQMPYEETVASSNDSPEIEVGSQIGRYKLLEFIAHGGMGRIYRAVHMELQKIVAVKVLPPHRQGNVSAIDRFRREMKALGQFSHPHVVMATDGGEDHGRFFLVMEYVEGFNLSELVKRLGPLPVADAAELMRQAALGVQAIHQKDLVHRDIKPSNIMLSSEGTVKVLDLGLSRFNANQFDAEHLTVAGQILGTKRYMAPEQFESSQVDARADLFSLAVSLETLLLGKTHFADSTDSHSLQGRDDIPEDLIAVLRRFTARTPADRPDSAEELITALQPFCYDSDLRSLLMRVMVPAGDSANGTDIQSEQPHAHKKRDLRSIKIWLCALFFSAVITLSLYVATTPDNFNENVTTNATQSGVSSGFQKGHPLNNSEAEDLPQQQSISPQSTEMLDDRQMAVWVLQRGGYVTRHPHGDIHSIEEIPEDGFFQILGIAMFDQKVKDADLLQFQRLPKLRTLAISNNIDITNHGLIELAKIKTLKWVYVGGTQINDDALASLNNLTELESLGLGKTEVTGGGIASLVKLKKLVDLQLNGTRITDAGLLSLKNFPNLSSLDLGSTEITNEGIANLAESATQLNKLQLDLTKITDEGIPHLEKLQQLKVLNLGQTAITPQAAASLRKALPACKIEHW